jgi:4-methylaminobutanoate oxidase (formaldehyde-forming)
MVSFVLDDPEVMMWGGELVLRDGLAVGQVMSAAWGGTLGACVALAYVWRRDGAAVTQEYLADGAYAINVGGRVCPATMHTKAPYDPSGERIKA